MKKPNIIGKVKNLFSGEGTVGALFNEWERKAERLTGKPGIDWTGNENRRTGAKRPDRPKREH